MSYQATCCGIRTIRVKPAPQQCAVCGIDLNFEKKARETRIRQTVYEVKRRKAICLECPLKRPEGCVKYTCVNKHETAILYGQCDKWNSFHEVEDCGNQSSMPELVIVTSLAPERLSRQWFCVQSWLRFGAHVIAYQHPHEIETLQPDFANVEFRVARYTSGKYVALKALAEAAKVQPVILANSDLELYGSQAEFAAQWIGGDDLILGFRWDYSQINRCEQQRYGIDAIRLTPAMAAAIDDTQIALGVPGWDWFLPLHLQNAGFHVRKTNGPHWFHHKHALRWQQSTCTTEMERLCQRYKITIDQMRELAVSGRIGGLARVRI